MRCADVVEPVIFKQLDAFFHGCRVGCRAECAQSMVVGYAFKQHLFSVELESVFGRELDFAYAEIGFRFVVGLAFAVGQFGYSFVQSRCLAAPSLWIGNLYCIKSIFPRILTFVELTA